MSRAQGWSRPLPCPGTAPTTTMLRDCPDHYRARGLPGPLPCSGTAQTTTVFGDYFDHYRARGLLRPLPCSGTVLNNARRLLSSATCDVYSHTVERHFIWTLLQGLYFTFQQARGLHRYDAPAGASRIACTTIGFLTSVEILFRPWHHVPTSPTTRLGD